MTDLSDKTAIVVGAAGRGNMGQAIARRLTEAGAHCVVAGRHEDALSELAREIGGTPVICDFEDKASIDALFDRAKEVAGSKGGHVDVAVNCTGWGLMKGWTEIEDSELKRITALQFVGVHHFLAAALRVMGTEHGGRGGSIVNISSATTQVPIFDHAAYIGTKAGAEALIRCFANQYGAQGLRANTVSPGLTDTPMTADAMAAPGLKEAFEKEYPLGRINTSEDIAHAVLWLADEGTFLTGQNLQANGGLTLRRNPTQDEIGASIAAHSS
ncbi:SDR family NAD(P)-dependent oxidoreductase [Erythrobacter sp.]|jgi:NAD(P)-dependent dehydrogenase (short-subunit alcohol dehydrogenase family)|uniref:SDR family NAD(P)-dependent oxidoreductase n=1 Tax=Erythrobacter sp. TaxID=1042 RepID=UPI002ECC5913|nr:SDR family oxidoreductase [Erythrobacter sp.]